MLELEKLALELEQQPGGLVAQQVPKELGRQLGQSSGQILQQQQLAQRLAQHTWVAVQAQQARELTQLMDWKWAEPLG